MTSKIQKRDGLYYYNYATCQIGTPSYSEAWIATYGFKAFTISAIVFAVSLTVSAVASLFA
jgi:hypothetical protein